MWRLATHSRGDWQARVNLGKKLRELPRRVSDHAPDDVEDDVGGDVNEKHIGADDNAFGAASGGT